MGKIIHIDMDAFYVSVEIRDNPSLSHKPVAVGGKLNTRSVLSTCNYLARKYGVRAAMPTSMALKICPQLIIVPGRMAVYKAVSKQLMAIFKRYTNVIEPLSLDEAYLEVTHCKLFNGSATLIAQDIRATIKKELNLTASAGIAPLKFLAKIASDLQKPNGQYVITPSEVSDFIDTLPLHKIPGVGKVTFDKLLASGLSYGADVRQLNEKILVEHFGKLGMSLWHKCQGIDNREVITTRIRKSIGVERTFLKDITDKKQLDKFLLEQLIPELKLRATQYLQQADIDKLGVKVKFKDFQQTTKEFRYHDFDNGVFVTLLNEALGRGKGKAVRLLGIHVGLSHGMHEQKQYNFQLC